jgi:chromosome transmission fidelity protein 18
VARHAGYRPLEVNASDDRSASVLTERIQRAMESTTLNLASDKRKGGAPNDQGKPNCLILDEIDGADAKGAIQALADIIKAEIPPKNSKQKSKSTVPYLRRPIICICNHKYAPALRPLLPYAVHFNVEPPSSARLVARLKTILNKEKVSMMAGGSLLHQLVVSTGGDIRSCLFTLQFAAAESRSDKDLSQSLMNSLNGSGLKDDRNDITSTITGVFRKVKSSAFESTTSKMVLSKGNAGVARVMHAVEGFADDTTAINVLFMNVLRVSYIDPAFDRCSAAHELLSGADMSLGSEYSMLRVNTQPVAAGIHLLCRVEVKPKLTFSSREMADSRYQQDANMALVQKFSEGLPVKASNFKCRDLLAKEFIPMVLWILSAGEGASSLSRPASSIDILTKAERGVADRHVSILCALGLSYTPDLEKETNAAKSSFRNDAIAMQLEPPIHRLVHYQCLWNNLRRKEIPANMKMLLAQEVRLESFRYKENEALPPGGKHKEPDSNSVIVLEATKRKVSNETETKIVNADSKGNPRKSNELEASATLPEAKRIKVGDVAMLCE